MEKAAETYTVMELEDYLATVEPASPDFVVFERLRTELLAIRGDLHAELTGAAPDMARCERLDADALAIRRTGKLVLTPELASTLAMIDAGAVLATRWQIALTQAAQAVSATFQPFLESLSRLVGEQVGLKPMRTRRRQASPFRPRRAGLVPVREA